MSFWKLFSGRVLGERGRPGESSAPFWSTNPAARGGSESEDCGRALQASPRPQALLRRQGETGSATPRVPIVFLGTRCWEGVPEGWRRHAARVEEWPGRFLHFSSPPSLTLILLPPRNLRSDGAESGFRGAHSEMGQLGARCCAGVPLTQLGAKSGLVSQIQASGEVCEEVGSCRGPRV
uniref:Uncharacterized protein n=1 Tax=Rangifer tarandus platyrhynchus TaxID=3082113 RepID=A0ACB0DRL1_RANTA|nr:unnamed protein product [Rangifer tarandus platyrhynchus]